MTTVYKIDVFGRLDDPEPTTYMATGNVIELDGAAFARLSGNILVRVDESWSATAADAKRRAAARLDAIAERISAKAAALRTEAATT